MAREDLLAEGHRAGERRQRRWSDPPLHTRAVVREEAAVLDDGRADRIEIAGELAHRDLFAARDAREEPEVGARQEADVLRVLAVDLLDALRDDELHSGRQLAVGRGLAARAATLRDRPLTMTPKPPFLTSSFWMTPPRKTDEAVPRQRLVVVVANPARGDLVGRDVGEERWPLPRRDRGEVLSAKLSPEERRVDREIENSSVDVDRPGRARHSLFLAHGCDEPRHAYHEQKTCASP
jgi:hypothetical protein